MKKTSKEEKQEMLAWRRKGLTYQAISYKYKTSRQRVFQLIGSIPKGKVAIPIATKNLIELWFWLNTRISTAKKLGLSVLYINGLKDTRTMLLKLEPLLILVN